MISPNTPPGSEVVCIDDSPGEYGPSLLTEGSIYTVSRIMRGISGEFAVVLAERYPRVGYHPILGRVMVGYGLERFRPLCLPESLTKIDERLLVDERLLEDA